jgi:hypothetical protein
MEYKESNREELIEKFISEIKSHNQFTTFFKGYLPSSVDSFVKLYAQKKAGWTISGKGFRNEMERMEMMWENEAMHRLEEIQQVKLFLYQCNYRAGAIDEPSADVRTIFDFMYWKDNVLNASFLEPVTPDDIELYRNYLMSDEVNHQPFGFIESWQDFEPIRLAYTSPEETDRNVPDWYQYYFERTGHGIELSLPDIKKEKDVAYFQRGNNERIRLLQEASQKEQEANPQLAAESKGVYFSELDGDNHARFMSLFENKENRELQKVWDAWTSFIEREDELRDDLDILLYATEEVPVPSDKSWIDATRIAASCYRSVKIGESLPAAYEQYKMNLDLGITFPEKENSRATAAFYNDLVLLGRKLNGEPENFDY